MILRHLDMAIKLQSYPCHNSLFIQFKYSNPIRVYCKSSYQITICSERQTLLFFVQALVPSLFSLLSSKVLTLDTLQLLNMLLILIMINLARTTEYISYHRSPRYMNASMSTYTHDTMQSFQVCQEVYISCKTIVQSCMLMYVLRYKQYMIAEYEMAQHCNIFIVVFIFENILKFILIHLIIAERFYLCHYSSLS